MLEGKFYERLKKMGFCINNITMLKEKYIIQKSSEMVMIHVAFASAL